ncbi:hypothetical protein LNQ52_29900 [Klebsiella pneumoniae subsp. pneumoniae]|nr:hypothetical protein [Klebsiella pneumoniae subsp. pneumoniae]
MRETRHEETKTRSPGTGTPTRISGRVSREDRKKCVHTRA